MANLKEIRTRISSVKSTRQITSAMKMVSAAKLRKAQDAIIQLRPYADAMQNIIMNVVSSELESESEYSDIREEKRVLIIAISSNRGLCGAFNMNVYKKVQALIEDEFKWQYDDENLDILCIGRKAYEVMKSRKVRVTDRKDYLIDTPSYEDSLEVVNDLMHKFRTEYYDRIIMVYNQFMNAASQDVKSDVLLPLDFTEINDEFGMPINANYIFEPDKDTIIREMIPKSIRLQFYKAILDSVASEHGARMTAMHQATDNATELIKELTLNYNKARQASITNEILEIVGGAEALKNN
jgi:F-type H+-transporting ATPase subunit gamma